MVILATNPPDILAVGKIAHLGYHLDKDEPVLQLCDVLYLDQLTTEEKHTPLCGDPDPVMGRVAIEQFTRGDAGTEAIQVGVVGEQRTYPFRLGLNQHVDMHPKVITLAADMGLKHLASETGLNGEKTANQYQPDPISIPVMIT